MRENNSRLRGPTNSEEIKEVCENEPKGEKWDTCQAAEGKLSAINNAYAA